jgi:lipid A ethanolaminephosphotransferase
VLVLVVGETARAANFSLGGYGQDPAKGPRRDTTPVLRALQTAGELHYFSRVTSCGTNTQASVPCMFSHQGKEAHESSKARFENLLDVLQRAGLGVVWLDNQSGCKGVCDRIPSLDTRELKDPRHCTSGECFDEVMLSVLDQQIAALPDERKAKGIVVVMHQMGSHGPAYYKRSPPEHKAFLPECSSNALPDCSRETLVNAYDNSIRYTDYFLGQTVQWLKRQPGPSAMLYVSDHGESLGENNLYLHGMPYALAPDVQKHVPMVLWLSEAMRQRHTLQTACVQQQEARDWSHDHLFHSVLGLLDVQTEVYQRTQAKP